MLAVFALLVQCLLPVGHAFAMSKASQDAAFAQSICSYHADLQLDADGEADAADLGGKLPLCPMCQAGCLGGVLALPTLPPSDAHLKPAALSAKLRWDLAPELSSNRAFDPTSPRGPPAII